MKLGIRWTIGNVRERGFEALRLSIWGAWQIFGEAADYCVCVNSVDFATAKSQAGDVPECVQWLDATGLVPRFLRDYMDESMAEGVAWKLAPLRVYPDAHELCLDNDCILWAVPSALAEWLKQSSACLMAEDVSRCFGQFDAYCPPEPRNAGLRGLPPGFDLEEALKRVLRDRASEVAGPLHLCSELDEQGLQTAAVSANGPAMAVSLSDVTICSPFYPHVPHLGRCGAHFVGLNSRHIAWDYYDRPADEWMTEHWSRCRQELLARIRVPLPQEAP